MNGPAASIIGLLLLIFVVWVAAQENAKWTLFYYPSDCRDCWDTWMVHFDQYPSLEACFAAGDGLLAKNKGRGDTYDCGKKCSIYDESEEGFSYDCEELRWQSTDASGARIKS